MIDTRKEVTYPIAVLAKKLPVRRSKSTIRRWIQDGFAFGDTRSPPVKLEYCIIGGVVHSSIEAYQRFVDECTNKSRQSE